MGAQAADLPGGNVGNKRFMAEGLALVYVGEVDFNNRYIEQQQGVTNGHTGVGEGGRIDDYCGTFSRGGLNPFYNLSFVVGLENIQFNLQGGSLFSSRAFIWSSPTLPYTSGSLVPNILRLGPCITSILSMLFMLLP